MDSPHPPRYIRDPLQPGCCDRSCYPSPRCFSCPSCCCCRCSRCCRCPCRCRCRLCWICWTCCCCPCCCLRWTCCSCSRCCCCYHRHCHKKKETSGCAIQSDLLPVQCSNSFCSEGSFSLSFSGLATLIPSTLIRGKPGKLYLDMRNFNQSLSLV